MGAIVFILFCFGVLAAVICIIIYFSSSGKAKAAKSATNKDVRLALGQLCKSGVALERNEEGVVTWRAKKVA